MTLKNPQSTRGIFMVCEHLPQSHCYTATFAVLILYRICSYRLLYRELLTLPAILNIDVNSGCPQSAKQDKNSDQTPTFIIFRKKNTGFVILSARCESDA